MKPDKKTRQAHSRYLCDKAPVLSDNEKFLEQLEFAVNILEKIKSGSVETGFDSITTRRLSRNPSYSFTLTPVQTWIKLAVLAQANGQPIPRHPDPDIADFLDRV